MAGTIGRMSGRAGESRRRIHRAICAVPTPRALLAWSMTIVVLALAWSAGIAGPGGAIALAQGDGDGVAPRAFYDASAARGFTIDGPITNVTFDYVDRAVGVAESENAMLVLTLNTPGGDVGSMGRIAERFLNATVPVVAWVGPRGAQAASAGTFLVLAAHASGMAPSTVIGAASPVGPGGGDLPSTMLDKVTEDLSAQARTFAKRRGQRAVDWAERAVREAASATADEALELGVIDAVAESPATLLLALDGTRVEVDGRNVRIRAPELADIAPEPIPMNAAERLLALLVQPAIALLLLTVGVQALLIELSNPGGSVAGAVGVVALVLGFYSLGALDANWVGLAFFVVAIAMFVLEVQASSGGIFVAIGVLLFILGSVILFADTAFGVPWATVIGLALAMGAFVFFVLGAIWRAQRSQPKTGFEGMLGREAEVKRALDPRGTVLIDGELWDAVVAGASAAGDRSPLSTAEPVAPAGSEVASGAQPSAVAAVAAAAAESPVAAGATVIVVGRDGFTLEVARE